MEDEVETLKAKYPDFAKLFNDEWMQYRKSEILPKLTWQSQSTCAKINRIYFDDPDEAMRLFRELVPGAGEGVDFRPPIHLDYGLGLTIGERTFINMDLLIVGGGPISIGSDCLIGTRCSICTPNHALPVKPRLEGWQHNEDVAIGNNVWLGSNVVVCPGVTIGDNCVIGAGSIVVRDIPADSVAVGNPCKVIHEVPQDWSAEEWKAAVNGVSESD
ncbi:sugar O-acetyltransferase [Bifidobacterium sp. ESL0690]|uniref:sugar O-acetyltransferase n=1 Tax=Bifidobacterium sp. ESL0690 TaxID=2983214 RepID=UPI0023F7F0F7|nr:sugar O-acetyltransferase [Bifidobacterium sp. ESL0690]WEV47290.1 sugar O-acetyltransferase [Bifidobacterium sp. ESL0690]